MKKLIIIDTFGLFFRLYYAMSGLKSKNGKSSGMVNGFANFISTIKENFESDYIAFALDSKGKTFRSEIDPNYKINRQTPPQGLLDQLPVCIDMIEKMGFYLYCKEGYEADDIIASIVKKYSNELEIYVATHDKDLYQLISENVKILSPLKKEIYDRNGCFEKYGVYPEQIRDFLSISGDSADNIPGVKGIGDKGAKKLLDEYGNLENIYANVENIRNERTKKMLLDSKENAFLSKKLVDLYDDLEVPDISKATFPKDNSLFLIKDILEEYSLNRLLSSMKKKHETYKLDFDAILITDEEELQNLVKDINEKTIVSFDTETTGIDSKIAKIVGFSFCFDENKSYYVPLMHDYLGVPKQVSKEITKKVIEKIFQGFVVGQNLKYDFKIIKNNFSLNPPKHYADTMLYAWLSGPGENVGMDYLAKKLYNYDTIKFESVVKKGETFASVDFESATKYASEDAWITLRFYKTFLNILEPKLLEIAENIEFPFIKVLLNMEDSGIEMDISLLKKIIEENNTDLKNLTDLIYSFCNEKFNINSPKQLGKVLFEHLKLPVKKKTKTGYSTDESVLSELLELHPIIQKILDYRELHKLQSTYCEPLLNLALKNKENRVYTSFLQTGTSTGRLSSKNPNLQNIPARGKLASKMRSCFKAKDGYNLISIDYSQIELRLLAHFSKDPFLVDAFKNEEDIHERTAISIFGESDKEKRSIAKSINFGLIYGMGSSKLAKEINVSRNEAKDYIDRYFKTFATVKDFLEGIKNDAKKDSFVTTLFGRKRYFDFNNASSMYIAMYEREAVNSKFQGSAADIIKKAMLEIYRYLNSDIYLLLQIHDELIFEVKEDKTEEFSKLAKNIMENIVKLNVPLVVSLNIGKNWGDLK